MNLETSHLTGANEMTVAGYLVDFVQSLYEPEDGWTLDSGLKCITVLLLATRMAYPTSENFESLQKRLRTPSPDDIDLIEIGGKLAEQIELIKKKIRGEE